MHAKLINDTLRSAPKKVDYNDKTVFNPTEEILLDMGYLPVTYTDMPTDAPTGQHYESRWEQRETEIKQVWELVDDPVESAVSEPTAEERMEILEGAVLELSEILYA